jgi:NAD(P)-dependent dehydrogenase (short-subunit alcohol dehydrogenase family)
MSRIFITGSVEGLGRAAALSLLDGGHEVDEPAARVSGRYWYNLRQQQPADEATDGAFRDHLLAELGELTGVALP